MENSEIEWTNHTFNPWIGFSHYSPGYVNCYAETQMDKRYDRVKWGVVGTRTRTSESYWKLPYKWNRKAAERGGTETVFCGSLADVFEDRDDLIDWRLDLFDTVIDKTPNLTWLLLTKRIDMAVLFLTWVRVPPNVWLGHSICTQRESDVVIPKLAKLQHKVGGIFLSCEPLLEPLDLGALPVNWVIIGGGSGPSARPCDVAWVRSIRDQCKSVDVPVLIKQLGSNPVGVPKLRSAKGGDILEWPKDLRVWEFPEFG
ncbi:DUF5131 family protein [Acaryochloris marina]|uniref:Phage protein Gp37/Gp68, putative n=1 Tax=Acaryochloris marina (strain MBIC 11017) TaxID=329726 RepID=A8ZQ11_ACAM1|nr:DUF5131 family protein [Acaryochloris marina]ABW33154.1 phage protein Gp37/Gp68, putative [Acaryochloris marina MBIC11017]